MSFLLRIGIIAVIAVNCLIVQSCVTENPRKQGPSIHQARNEFIQGHYKKSYPQLVNLAKWGNPIAQYALGYMYFYGLGVKTDQYKAVRWINVSARNGS